MQTPALGGDLTSVKCKEEWLPLDITVDPISSLALIIDALSAEDSKTLTAWIEPIAKSVGAQVLVTDDADGENPVADEVGIQHQVCKAHVLCNLEILIECYQPLVVRDTDGSLKAIGVSPEQAAADLTRVANWSRVDNGSRLVNWKRCIDTTCKPRRKQERIKVWLSSATLVSRSLESLASLDALSQMERTLRGNA